LYSAQSREQLRPSLREPHIGAALVHRQPAALDSQLQPSTVLLRTALELIQERTVDLLNMYPAVLYGFDRVRDLDQFAGGGLGIGVGLVGLNFIEPDS
jgi:hypothetical protein